MEEENFELRETLTDVINIKEIESLTMQKVEEQFYKAFSLYGHRRSYVKGNNVFQINDPADEIYFVEKGRIRTYNLTPEGKEITFEIHNPGESLGWAEVLVNSPRTRYAEGVCNKNTLWVMNKDQLFYLMYSNKEFNFQLIWSLTHYVLRYKSLVENLAILPVHDRVIQLLVRMSKDRGLQIGDCIVIDFPISNDDIAKMVGSSRQTITLIINELRERGIINWEQKKIKILRLNDLCNLT
ncbi:MAG: hypothetical protein APF81_08740 [Desulfosporosinus sp. BRH_c37]|nr:MAG: hypothetical protein APF81_08740 [Desulfosporosinus sp. BRH_c37]